MKNKRINFSYLLLFLLFQIGMIVACMTEPYLMTPVWTATPPIIQLTSPTVSFFSSATLTATVLPGVAPMLPAVPVSFVTNGNRMVPFVALTFDVCQDPQYPAGFDSGIVNVLQQYNAPATFFMGGDWMRTHPEETKLLALNPLFELGNHSWSHPDLRTLSKEEISHQIVLTQDMLYKLTGRQSHLFRLPSGFSNDLVLQTIANHGLYTIQWDVVTGDPDPNFNAETIQRAVREGVQNGSIIIMHANGRGWHTAEALPGIIEYLTGQGYMLVTISQLIGLQPVP